MKIALYVAALAILAGLVGGLVHLSKKAARVDVAEAAQHAAEKKQVDQALEFAKSTERFDKQQAHDQAADAALNARLTQLEEIAGKLRAAGSTIPATTEKADAQGIRRTVINPDWWLCQSATLSGDTADAEACIARSVTGGLSPPVSP